MSDNGEEFEPRGITVRDISCDKFITAYAEHLKNSDKFEAPAWADTVKTGVFKEMCPFSEDWYYVRAASIARKIYLRPGTGVGALQRWYGGVYRRGTRTEHFRKANSGIIRSILQGLEEMRVVEQDGAKGRKVTRVGQQDLDRIAGGVAQEDNEE